MDGSRVTHPIGVFPSDSSFSIILTSNDLVLASVHGGELPVSSHPRFITLSGKMAAIGEQHQEATVSRVSFVHEQQQYFSSCALT